MLVGPPTAGRRGPGPRQRHRPDPGGGAITHNELMSAISRLGCPSRNPKVGRSAPIYLEAAGAFNRSGPPGWLWFMSRGDEMVDDGDARA